MHYQSSAHGRLVTPIVLLFLLVPWALRPALAGPVPDASALSGVETLWQWQDRYVRIVPQDTPEAPPNDHPARLTPQELAPLLAALQVTRPSKRRFNRKVSEHRQLAVFSDRELEVLARALSKGLARAGPRQDVIFFITGDHDAGVRGMFKNHDVNAARVFVWDGELNIVFGEVHGAYAGRAVEDTGSRERRAAGPWALVAASGIRRYRQGEEVRKDWVVIDPHMVLEQYRQRGWHISDAAIEPAGGEPPAADTPKASTTAPLEVQLGVLKELREQNLITEEIYKERVHRLLDEQLPQQSTD